MRHGRDVCVVGVYPGVHVVLHERALGQIGRVHHLGCLLRLDISIYGHGRADDNRPISLLLLLDAIGARGSLVHLDSVIHDARVDVLALEDLLELGDGLIRDAHRLLESIGHGHASLEELERMDLRAECADLFWGECDGWGRGGGVRLAWAWSGGGEERGRAVEVGIGDGCAWDAVEVWRSDGGRVAIDGRLYMICGYMLLFCRDKSGI